MTGKELEVYICHQCRHFTICETRDGVLIEGVKKANDYKIFDLPFERRKKRFILVRKCLCFNPGAFQCEAPRPSEIIITDNAYCKLCGKKLIRQEDEPPGQFKKRKYCKDTKCILKRHKIKKRKE